MIRHDKKLFLQGALILSGAAFLSKLMGALWRIPLTNLIGSEGIGRYQMIYPVYCLLLTLSSVGIPSALSRLVAEGKAPMKAATKLFLSIGAGSALLMILLAPLFSFLQGIPSLRYGYYALAPAVTLVSGIAILRGYFQGRRKMTPIGISQIIEQGVKIGLGLLVASRYRSDPVRAVTGILLAVTISEAVALLFLLLLPKGERTQPKEEMCARAVWKETFPVSLSAMILPFSAWIDGLLLPRLLGENGVSLYGLLTGCALLLVNLPSSLASGIASSLVPSLAKGENTHGSAFVLTALLSLPVTVVLIVFPALPMKLFSLS
ncbi:MAG: oligosaccharide flippase family protein [Christensenellaceae bacterium]